MKRVLVALAIAVFGAPLLLHAQGSGAVSSDLPEVRRVLLIGAHPDDEDTNLIAWLQRGGRAETAYLSLTRGDGGQNLIGNELGQELGVIRTEELLAARRIDGAHQFFTRAFDFGFSKSAEETYAHWPKDSVLNDVVTVVRSWRPHVIVAMFSGTPRDGHGQHQVSALLAKEAYDLAGDTARFPVSKFGPAWTPDKFYRTMRFQPDSATLIMNVGEYDPDLRRSFAEIAGESRSEHKSQGFGALQRKGVVWNYVRRVATRVNEATPANSEKSMFDGVRAVPFGKAGERGPYAGIRPHISLEAFADRRNLAIGDSARVNATLYNRSRQTIYARPQVGGNLRLAGKADSVVAIEPDSSFRWNLFLIGETLTRPWWLTSPRNGDLFAPPLPRLQNASEWYDTPDDRRTRRDLVSVHVYNRRPTANSPALVKEEPVEFRYLDAVRGDTKVAIAVTPRLSVTLENERELARADAQIERFFNVTLRSASMRSMPVVVSLNLPSGLTADSASRSIVLDSVGTRTISFRVSGRLKPGMHEVSARAVAGGETYASGYEPIEYDHITPQRMYRPATVALNAVEIKVPAKTNVAYIPGVGDNVAASLAQLGVPVTVVSPRDVPTLELSKFSAVIVGPRAYDANRELIDNNAYLLEYARNGGTLVVQYGQYEMMQQGVMPYAISISRPHDRVTEEVAPVRILEASAPAFHAPNEINAADFSGWVQERGLYMPRTFDDRYQPLVELNDPGAPPNRGGIIVAPYGKGLYVYTTLAFFRQLPAGVAGASKLFVNLISLDGSSVRSTPNRAAQ